MCGHSAVGVVYGGGSSYRSKSAGSASDTTSSTSLCYSLLCVLSCLLVRVFKAVYTGWYGEEAPRTVVSAARTVVNNSLGAPSYGAPAAVLWLLIIKEYLYNLHGKALLKTQASVDTGNDGDHKRLSAHRKEELIHRFYGRFQPSSILALSRPPLVVWVVTKYAPRL